MCEWKGKDQTCSISLTRSYTVSLRVFSENCGTSSYQLLFNKGKSFTETVVLDRFDDNCYAPWPLYNIIFWLGLRKEGMNLNQGHIKMFIPLFASHSPIHQPAVLAEGTSRTSGARQDRGDIIRLHQMHNELVLWRQLFQP